MPSTITIVQGCNPRHPYKVYTCQSLLFTHLIAFVLTATRPVIADWCALYTEHRLSVVGAAMSGGRSRHSTTVTWLTSRNLAHTALLRQDLNEKGYKKEEERKGRRKGTTQLK